MIWGFGGESMRVTLRGTLRVTSRGTLRGLDNNQKRKKHVDEGYIKETL